METPLTDHLNTEDFKQVYEPAEDSFLLLDALERDLTFIKELEPSVCLEIGSGSGIIITAIAKTLKNSLCLATDINSYACKATKQTAEHNLANVDVVHCNLLDSLRSNAIDLLCFNPPYVVTSDDELKKQTLEMAESTLTSKNLVYSWAGGEHGRRVIDVLLANLSNILSESGVLYLLLLRENKPDELIKQLETMSFNAIKFMERRIPGEYLYILKVTRKM